jgi:leucyl aminopeptidase
MERQLNVTVISGSIEKQKTDAAVLFLHDDGKLGPAAARTDKAVGGMISRLLKQGDFSPKPGNVCLLYPAEKVVFERLILAGLGKKADFTLNRLRQAAGKAAPHARSVGAKNIVLVAEGFDADPEEAGQALTEGALLGLYRYRKYKTNDESDGKKEIRDITILAGSAQAVTGLRRGVKTGSIIAGSAAMVRDMVEQPSADASSCTLRRERRTRETAD